MKEQPQNTLVHLIERNATVAPDYCFNHWVDKNCQVVDTLTHRNLWLQSASVADCLLKHGVEKGDRVMIAYPFGLEFLAGFFGCMRIGVIPCSVYPPNPKHKSVAKHSFNQFNSQVEDAGAKFALTTFSFKVLMRTSHLRGYKTSVTWLATDKLKERKNICLQHQPSPEDIAFIQYSSGSTGDPKGIVLTHKAVLHNIRAIQNQLVNSEGELNVGVSWLPQYHDYSLVCSNILPAVLQDVQTHNASPLDFIQNPLLWADMIDKFRPTTTGGPNFSYSLLAKRMKQIGRRLDQKACRLKSASVAAEMIDPSTLDKMVELGIPKHAICPCYGFAETVVFCVACPSEDIKIVDGRVSCGTLSASEVSEKFAVTVDTSTGKIIRDGSVGEIFVRGPDLASGYWGHPQLTDKAFHNRLEDDGHDYFRTGDLGRILDGRLFVVGRVKEVIIINGRNVYPTDLERIVEAEYPGVIRPGSTVAYQHTDSEAGIVMELRDTAKRVNGSPETLLSAGAIRSLLSNSHGCPLGTVTLLKQGTVPKTTSGKLRRVETKNRATSGSWKPSTIIWTWCRDEDQSAGTPPNKINSAEKPLSNNNEASEADKIDLTFISILGGSYDENLTWEENGLSSTGATELSSGIDSTLLTALPTDFVVKYPTPALLKSFLLNRITKYPVKLPKLRADKSEPVSSSILWCVFGIGIMVQLLVFMLSLGPAYFVGKAVSGDKPFVLRWTVLPLILPTFMLSFSLLVIVAKWLIVGRYRPQQLLVSSPRHVAWWLVDRLLHLWEFWVGAFIVKTPLITVFYVLLGAKIDMSSEIEAFVREFDLVTIGSSCVIQHNIRCRRFGVWTDKAGPTLRFRPIVIESGCQVKGFVSLGSHLQAGTTIEEKTVLPEGAQVSSQGMQTITSCGSCGAHERTMSDCCSIWMLKGGKILWLFVELYLFFTLFQLSSSAWDLAINSNLRFRYSGLLKVIASLLTAEVASIIVSISMKWALLGRRRAEGTVVVPSKRREYFEWICDYHFEKSAIALRSTLCLSRIWNAVLWAHGLDIDWNSQVTNLTSFTPSNVDMVRIRNSLLSVGVSFKNAAVDGSCADKTVVENSTVSCRVLVHPGVKIVRSTVRPFSELTESLQDYQSHGEGNVSFWRKLALECSSLVVAVLLFFSFVPSLELFWLITSKTDETSWVVLGVVTALLAQLLTWTVLLRIVQFVVWQLPQDWDVYSSLYGVTNIGFSWSVSSWAQWSCLWGTPFMNVLLRAFGADVKGELLYYGREAYDYPMLVFEDKTIIDESQVMGHHMVGTKLTLEKSIHSGLLHMDCFTFAGTKVVGRPELGPSRAYLGRCGETSIPHDEDEYEV